jgi:3-oxoadipate CoA-transferase alpha subunit
MIDKIVPGVAEAVAGISDGATILVGGFGHVGAPDALCEAVADLSAARDLTVVSNNAGGGEVGLAKLLKTGRVRRIICSHPRSAEGFVFRELFEAGRIELELNPQGTLAERMRAAGAGIPAFFTPTAAGTRLADGKETRDFNGRPHVLETALHGDVALIGAHTADRWGNLAYIRAGRNFNPIMAAAAKLTIAQVQRIVPLGAMEPDAIHTSGVYVQRVVKVEHTA